MRTFILLSAFLSLCSCHTAHYKFSDKAEQYPVKHTSGGEDLHHTFIFGLYEPEALDLKSLCPEGVHTVRSRQGPIAIGINWILSGLQVPGIYTPWNVKVTCTKKSRT